MPAKPVDLTPPSPPSPKRKHSRAIVEAIVQAVRELPPGSKMQAIADRAGVGVASVYRYFPGREAIYAELARRMHEQLLVASTDALSDTDTLEDAVRACCLLGLQMDYGEAHVVQHVHQNTPFAWHGERASLIITDIVEVVAQTIDRFLVGTPRELRTRAFLAFTMAGGASRSRVLLPELAPTDEEALAPMWAGIMACVTQGLERRTAPLRAMRALPASASD